MSEQHITTDRNIADQMAERLRAELSPVFLNIEDVSWQHEGHAGARPGGQSHFNLEISDASLDELSRVAAHRKINSILADFLAGPVHALQITIRRPG